MEEKEFEPTRKKLKQARSDGRVVYSSELALGIIMLAFFSLFYLIGPSIYSRFEELFSFKMMSFYSPIGAISPILKPLILYMITLFMIAYAAHFLQIGFLWAWPKKSKKIFRFFLPLLKLIGLLTIFYFFFKTTIPPFSANVRQLLVFWAKSLHHLGLFLALYLLCIGIFDYLYQRWRFLQEMRMTKAEKKDEKKD